MLFRISDPHLWHCIANNVHSCHFGSRIIYYFVLWKSVHCGCGSATELVASFALRAHQCRPLSEVNPHPNRGSPASSLGRDERNQIVTSGPKHAQPLVSPNPTAPAGLHCELWASSEVPSLTQSFAQRFSAAFPRVLPPLPYLVCPQRESSPKQGTPPSRDPEIGLCPIRL